MQNRAVAIVATLALCLSGASLFWMYAGKDRQNHQLETRMRYQEETLHDEQRKTEQMRSQIRDFQLRCDLIENRIGMDKDRLPREK